MTHYLKTWPSPFKALKSGKKPWEYRKNDRNFQVGDTLVLQEWKENTLLSFLMKGRYTGKEIKKEVTYILKGGQFGLPLGYVIMSIK